MIEESLSAGPTTLPDQEVPREALPDSPAILLQGVRRHYGKGATLVPAIDGIDLRVEKGEFIALIGPSGSGKSTLLNLIGAMDKPTSGAVVLDGEDLAKKSRAGMLEFRRRTVGLVFQSYNLIPNLSAVENVELPMELAGINRADRRVRALALLDSVAMLKRADHRPGKLSGGEQQRVAIARALANDPAIILADEPTGNLDTKTGRRIIQLLSSLCRTEGKTLVVVTHDRRVAKKANRVIYLEDGKIGTEDEDDD